MSIGNCRDGGQAVNGTTAGQAKKKCLRLVILMVGGKQMQYMMFFCTSLSAAR